MFCINWSLTTFKVLYKKSTDAVNRPSIKPPTKQSEKLKMGSILYKKLAATFTVIMAKVNIILRVLLNKREIV